MTLCARATTGRARDWFAPRAPRFATGGKAWRYRPDAVTTHPDAVTARPDTIVAASARRDTRGGVPGGTRGGIPGDTRGDYRLTRLQLRY